MWNRVPILAYDATAVPETLGRGGVVLTDKSPLHVAVAADRILRDDDLRRSLVEAGTVRIADFELERTSARLIEFLTPLVEGDGS